MNAALAKVQDSTGAPGEPGPLGLRPAEWKRRGVNGEALRVGPGSQGNTLECFHPDDGLPLQTVVDPDRYHESRHVLAGLRVRRRLTGPIRFVLKLVEFWGLESDNVAALLGFDQTDAAHVAAVLDGTEMFRGRDVRDRIAHLYWIRATLRSLFHDLEVENQWLREPHSLLNGKAPLALLLNGSMEDLLIVKEYVDTVAGR